MPAAAEERGMLFVDSSNFYHSLGKIGCSIYHVDFPRLAKLLLMGRTLVDIWYYAAPVDQYAVPKMYKGQQQFWADLTADGVKLKHGYLQERNFRCSKCGYTRVGVECEECGHEFAKVEEKGVDVHIAADLVYYAATDAYDWAYLISSDGDLAGACERARELGKKVLYVCVPPIESMALKTACNYTAKKDAHFFGQCHIADQ